MWCNILINRSVTQVFHNSTHKVARGGVPAKVSCPYLGCAHRHTQTHTHDRWVQGEEGIKGKGEGERERKDSSNNVQANSAFNWKAFLKNNPSHSHSCLRHNPTSTERPAFDTSYRRKKRSLSWGCCCIIFRAELTMHFIWGTKADRLHCLS